MWPDQANQNKSVLPEGAISHSRAHAFYDEANRAEPNHF